MSLMKEGWLPQTIASCYVNSPLPKLTSRLRRRHSLSISRGGLLPAVSLHKRVEPTGRVLCFHRINDDNDPFFPSIPVKAFDQVMRFIAHNHKTVSLEAMMEHVNGGSPGTVLGITFDDGYQDNYEHAFPILRRYGLPATIFLTTGVIDSREPLWFEQLAEALKKAPQDFIDVEIDVPRRFWLRSPEERLRAHGEISGLLRRRPDTELRWFLESILRLTGADRNWSRRDKMLTWDQIREMKKSRIDFGGHTVTHPFLSKTTTDQMLWEVSECKRRIESELQAPVMHFAYPHGREEDIGRAELLRRAGYKAAVTTIWGVNSRSTNPLELRRSGPWENTPALFSSKLDWYELANQ